MKPLNIYFPGKLVFGRNVLSGLVEEIGQMGVSRVLILTIAPLLEKIREVMDELEKLRIEVKTDISVVQEPSFSDLRKLMERVDPFDPDLVLGIGGGSVLDIAKLVAAQSGNEQELEEYVGIGLLKRRPKKLICVPATSGTGSEVSPNAILVDERDNQKKGIISPFLVPDVVYVDPLLTMSVPASITAATGLDALTHCMEAYTNLYAQPFIDMYALEGIRSIGANLVRAVRDGSDEEAREKVAMGSLLGGFCLGPVNTAAVHALSYPLGSTFHLPHGLSNALLLPHVMEFNYAAVPCRYAEVAVALGCARDKDDRVTAQMGVERTRSLIAACGIPSRLSEVGIPRNAIIDMAIAAMKITRLLKNNPRTVTMGDAIAIYESAY
ncbi:MAG TPA: iron-containing alcohol dehydrogenase [Puia sp.]|jgi:alcohol dehydrogenase class IV